MLFLKSYNLSWSKIFHNSLYSLPQSITLFQRHYNGSIRPVRIKKYYMEKY